MRDVSNADDMIDSRDILERIEELEALRRITKALPRPKTTHSPLTAHQWSIHHG